MRCTKETEILEEKSRERTYHPGFNTKSLIFGSLFVLVNILFQNLLGVVEVEEYLHSSPRQSREVTKGTYARGGGHGFSFYY